MAKKAADRSPRVSRRWFLKTAGAGAVGVSLLADAAPAPAQGRLSDATLQAVARAMGGSDLSPERVRGWSGLLQDVVFSAAAKVREPDLFNVEPAITFSPTGERR